MWQACREMLERVPVEYRLAGTAFTKVTLALNNPTPVHRDDNNFGLTFLICFELDEAGSLVGGSHVIYSEGYERAVLVSDCPEGVVLLGDYRCARSLESITRRVGPSSSSSASLTPSSLPTSYGQARAPRQHGDGARAPPHRHTFFCSNGYGIRHRVRNIVKFKI